MKIQEVVLSDRELHLNGRNRESPSSRDIQALQPGYFAPMGWRVGHEELVEGAKAAWETRRKTHEPEKLFLITAEFADDR